MSKSLNSTVKSTGHVAGWSPVTARRRIIISISLVQWLEATLVTVRTCCLNTLRDCRVKPPARCMMGMAPESVRVKMSKTGNASGSPHMSKAESWV